MAFTATTNVDGSNPGPNSAALPDTVQSPVGNVWKLAVLTATLTPATVTNAGQNEQTFAITGLLTTDLVFVNAPVAANAGLGIAGSRVSAAGVLAINFVNAGSTTTVGPPGTYVIGVMRIQPNWTAPATGSQLDW